MTTDRSEADTSAEAVLRSVWQADADDMFFLSQASHGLGLVARAMAASPPEPPRLWFPDYYCDAALDFARAAGAVIIFYPVTSALEPDWPACRALAEKHPPALFALVHYFGRLAPVPAARAFCTAVGALLLEDCAHLLRPAGDAGRHGDIVCYSPRKFFDVPDGGLLVVRGNNLAADVRAAAQALAGTRNNPLNWRWHRFVRNTKIRLRPSRAERPLPPTTLDAAPGPAEHFRHPWMSAYARRQIAAAITTGAIDRLAERHRQFHAVRAERHAGALSVMPWSDGLVSNWTAGLSPAAAATEAILNQLRRQSERVITWPTLPPEVRAAAAVHPAATDLRRRILLMAPRRSLAH